MQGGGLFIGNGATAVLNGCHVYENRAENVRAAPTHIHCPTEVLTVCMRVVAECAR